jgi:GAF domain-containing protein
MCGRSYREALPIVVRDVAELEGGYIACDPRDRSEVVVPCFDDQGKVYAVLDVDGYAPNDFSAHDAERLHDLLVRSGLSSGGPRDPFLI